MGLAYGLQISTANVTMQSLRPYDTTARLGYITTLAEAWIPSNLTDTLISYIVDANSSIYHYPDTSVNTLMSLLSPLVIGMLSSESTTPSLSPNSKNSSAGFKVVIGVLVPVGVMAILFLIVAYRRQQRRKHAVSRHPAKHKRTKDNHSSPFLQQKPELNGEEQMREMSAEERWMELHGEGIQELQGGEVPMELHGEGRHEMQAEESRHELATEETRQELPAERWNSNHRAVALADRIEEIGVAR